MLLQTHLVSDSSVNDRSDRELSTLSPLTISLPSSPSVLSPLPPPPPPPPPMATRSISSSVVWLSVGRASVVVTATSGEDNRSGGVRREGREERGEGGERGGRREGREERRGGGGLLPASAGLSRGGAWPEGEGLFGATVSAGCRGRTILALRGREEVLDGV